MKIANQIAINLEEIKAFIRTRKDDMVFVSGSLIEGFGNEGSDIDVYLISKEEPLLDPQLKVKDNVMGHLYSIPGYTFPIDVIYISEQKFMHFLHEFNYKLLNNTLDLNETRNIELIHRLHVGVPLQNQERFQFAQESIDIQLFCQRISTVYLKYSENRHEDAVGALESEDMLTAFLAARISLEKSVDALLCICGETNTKDKWLFRRLTKHFSAKEEWVEKFITFYIGVNYEGNESALKEQCIQMLRLANQIRLKAYNQSKR